VKLQVPVASERRACRVLSVPRASVRPRLALLPRPPVVDQLLALRIREVIRAHPTFGYRRIWALLRFREGVEVNRKAATR
jgi:putative transposase